MENFEEFSKSQLQRLEKKYEYLFIADENLYHILDEIFNEFTSNDIDVNAAMEIENKFILYVITEIKNKNENLKDALSECMQFVNQLVIKKIASKLKNISKEELEILYDDAIEETIQKYENGNFSTFFVNILKSKYLNYINGDINNNSKRDSKNTIYNYFECYPRDLIDVVFSTVSSNIRQIFIKKWGKELDGENTKQIKKYEIEELNNSINIFKKTLIKAKELRKKGKSDADIISILKANKNNKDFLDKNVTIKVKDIKQNLKEKDNLEVHKEEGNQMENKKPIAKVKIMPIQNPSVYHFNQTNGTTIESLEKKPKTVKKYKNVEEIAEAHKATVKEIEDAVIFFGDNMRICFSRYYGINGPRFSAEEIIDDLKISKHLFKSYLINADDMIDKYIIKNRDSFNKFEKEKSVIEKQMVEKPIEEKNEKIELSDNTSKIVIKVEPNTNEKAVEKRTIKPIAKLKIDPIINDEKEFDYINESSISDYEKIIIYLKMKYKDVKQGDQLISEQLHISIHELIECYIDNLDLFKNSMDKILRDILKENPNNFKLLFKSIKFNKLISDLSLKEKLYLYLKLLDYQQLSTDELATVINDIVKQKIK